MRPLRVWPVIHLHTVAQAVANARIDQAAGAHGVFLIHMSGDDDMIEPAGRAISEQCPGLVVGANYLSLSATQALERSLAAGFAATWSDAPGVHSTGVNESARALASRVRQHPGHEFFASVAFKYQEPDPDPGKAASAALSLDMIPTTSGPATGQAPAIEKLQAIRASIGPSAALALASGVTPENVAQLVPCLSDILVATGISADFHTFDPARLSRLMAACGLRA